MSDRLVPAGRPAAPMPSNLLPPLDVATRFALFGDLGLGLASPGSDDWASALEPLVEQRLGGLALTAIRRSGVTVDDAIRRRLREVSFEAASRSERVLQRAAEDLGRLTRLKIDFVVTKGPGLSRLDGGAAVRPYDDIDVIVAPDTFSRALDALVGLGYEERKASRPPRVALTRWCREGINLRCDGGGSIDLHHTIAPWLWGRGITFPALCDQAVIDDGRTGLPFASVEHNLLVAALHLVSDRGRPGKTLRVWRDVVLTAGAASAAEAARQARAAGLAGWLQWILGCLPAAIQPQALMEELDGGGRIPHRRRLQYLLPPHLASRHVVGQALRLPGPNAALFLAGMLFPSPAFLADKYPALPHPMTTWWRDCAGGVSRV